MSTAAEFLKVDVYIEGVDDKGLAVAKILIEVYITDNLKANILVGTGILKVYSILLNLGT